MRKLAVNHLKRRGELMIADCFAGGGGASTGIEMALGRSPDVAINHDPEALAMHLANHPRTRHYATDVFDVDPRVVVRDKPVGLAWFSPDCTHHSKARGGKPIREAGKRSRSLAWVVVKWAESVRPRVIILENVEEFQQWGPLVDGRPCPARKGQTFRKWVRALEKLGYAVEWRELRACDYGAPTIRKRLFVIARCDGRKIVWPKPTHAKPAEVSGELLPWRTAAEIIDWSIPCPSIFLTPDEAKLIGCKRPLKDSTLRRIARGLQRFVLDNPKPFIVPITHSGSDRTNSIDDPLRTVTTAKRGEFSVVTPYIETHYGDKGGTDLRVNSIEDPLRTQPTENRFGLVTPFLGSTAHSTSSGREPNVWTPGEPLRTITTSNDHCVMAPHLQSQFGQSVGREIDGPAATVMPGGQGKAALVSAFMAQHNTGPNNLNLAGRSTEAPLSTLTTMGTQQQVVAASIVGCGGRAGQSPPTGLEQPVGTVTGKADKCLAAAHLSHLRTSNTAGGDGSLDKPLNALTAGGNHVAQVMAFLQKYYGSGGQHSDPAQPIHTLTAKARMGLVTVAGVDYQITDIGMRMLSPRELFSAQGFPPDYFIDVVHAGRKLPKSSQVRMCGNSVCPPLAAALVAANCPDLKAKPRAKEWQRELAGV